MSEDYQIEPTDANVPPKKAKRASTKKPVIDPATGEKVPKPRKPRADRVVREDDPQTIKPRRGGPHGPRGPLSDDIKRSKHAKTAAAYLSKIVLGNDLAAFEIFVAAIREDAEVLAVLEDEFGN